LAIEKQNLEGRKRRKRERKRKEKKNLMVTLGRDYKIDKREEENISTNFQWSNISKETSTKGTKTRKWEREKEREMKEKEKIRQTTVE
jgi:hypothetical protein